jgi:hypothetical protein
MEVWQIKPPTLFEEEMKAKKSGKPSVLEDEDNADKVITALLGHNFTVLPDKEKNEE